jgi:nucleotide-binding universal stress UspA family protein
MKPFERLLIPTDGSDNAKAAAIQGLALAKLLGAEVTAISVMDIRSLYYSRGARMTAAFSYQFLEDEANLAVEEIRKEGEAIGVAVKKLIRKGAPANEIVEASKDYDLIVIGTLGRSGLAHLLMGSVAEKVVRFAYCPVLVIRAH